ncbi:MAG: hypothetical protein DSZ21_01085 [Tenericutes bacterium]|nr:MAG: hypothetical protein DSZ21_01085 [Mycoplasmatota bacterium]
MNKVEEYFNNELRKNHPNILDLKNSEILLSALLIRRMQASSYPKLLNVSIKQAIEEIKNDEYDYNDLENDNINNENDVNSKEIEKYIEGVVNDSKFKKMIES